MTADEPHRASQFSGRVNDVNRARFAKQGFQVAQLPREKRQPLELGKRPSLRGPE